MKLTKAFFLLFILATLSFSALSQHLPFKGCQTDSCHQMQFESLMKKVEALLFEKAGFAYNDSVAITLVQQNGKVRFLDFHAWVNPKAKYGYLKVIYENSALLALEDSLPYTFYWKQKVSVPTKSLNDMASVPLVNECSTYNLEAKKGCYRYLYSGFLAGLLPKANFNDWLIADLVFKGGELTAIHFICPPQWQKAAVDLGPIFLSVQEAVDIPKGYSADSTYTIQFSYHGGFDNNIDHLDSILSVYYWKYYTDNSLWKPLKRILSTLNTNENDIIKLDTSFGFNNPTPSITRFTSKKSNFLSYSAHNFLKANSKALNTKVLWYDAVSFKISENKYNNVSAMSHQFVDKAPLILGCPETNDSQKSIQCFEQMTFTKINSSYFYPSEAALSNGRILITFTISDDCKIENTSVLRGISPDLDRRAIEAVLQLPVVQPALFEDKPVKIAYTTFISIQ